ncbi:disease resistance protein RGA5 [Triticum aestivum]|uniref:disease resistance protein RGA5 n=1 Tax=Triticum aestivum TaxID=4565 RepID=UPI001D0318A0|nr:disease resistance protein RGA5-like [Triticum aestivum]
MTSSPTVSATMGVMNPLLGKLATLMGDEYRKLKGVRKQASFLMRELGAMKAALEKLEVMEVLDPLAKNWRDHVREMSYDMENCIDDFMRQFGGADAKAGLIKKTAQRLKTLRERHRIAEQMEELKALALEANERRMRYKIDNCVDSSSGVVPVDPPISAIYKEAAGLVGIDGPREELVSWLIDTEKQLKVVSVVGFGGLGKTTLAKQVYNKIGGQFERKAFVSVSQRPDMTSLLCGLQLKLGMEESSHIREVQDIIDRLREHLTHKRYLIVVDDLWDQSAWNIISCAFPEDGNGSRVIVTTRLGDVAFHACLHDRECIYQMNPLQEQDSRSLFYNRVFGSEDSCPQQFKEVSAEILKKCGGLPLAIITIASLLASRQARSRSEWESIRDSLSSKFATKPTLEEMRSILNLSYMHLPLYLRACFLYLGMYPEDRKISKVDLVRQWVAEGFVSNLHGSNLEDAAKSYFHELINRGMIQPEDTICGEVLSCSIHDMMLDLILSKCGEDNFIRVAYDYKDMAQWDGCNYRVRRLSLKLSAGSATSETIATSLTQIRSFAWFGESKYTPPLSEFKYLRVLLFDFPDYREMVVDRTAAGQLFQLRYLKVSAASGSIELPTEIHGPVHLETIDIDCRMAQNIPSDIVMLHRLSHFILPRDTGLPNGIGNMKSLRTLRCYCMGKSSLDDIEGLGELTNLRELTLTKSYKFDMVKAGVEALVSSIGKLCDLKFLYLACNLEHYVDLLDSISDPPLRMENLRLGGWPFYKVPKWIGDLHCLHRLSLCVERLRTDGVHVLGQLPSLMYLSLKVLCIPQDNAVIICTGSFPVLECLALRSRDDDATACMGFEAGAMPKLRRLVLGVHDRWGGGSAMPVGMVQLLSLEQIHVDNMSSIHDDHDVESAFRNAAQVHPRCPHVTIY